MMYAMAVLRRILRHAKARRLYEVRFVDADGVVYWPHVPAQLDDACEVEIIRVGEIIEAVVPIATFENAISCDFLLPVVSFNVQCENVIRAQELDDLVRRLTMQQNNRLRGRSKAGEFIHLRRRNITSSLRWSTSFRHGEDHAREIEFRETQMIRKLHRRRHEL